MKKKVKGKAPPPVKSAAWILPIIITAALLIAGLFYLLKPAPDNSLLIVIEPIDSGGDDQNETADNYFEVLLHQSYVNDTDISMNQTQNTITVDLPEDPNFNSSYTEIKIKSIQAHNDTINEDVGFEALSANAAAQPDPLVASFKVIDSCVLRNITIYGDFWGNALSFKIFNSTWDGTRSIPGGNAGQNITGWTIAATTSTGYFSLNFDPSFILNVSTTQNNTFFLGIEAIASEIKFFNWGSNSTSNRQYNYFWQSGWDEQLNEDYIFNISISPLNATGLPSDYGFKINGTSVSDTAQQEGIWTSNEVYDNSNQNVSFEILPTKWNNISWIIDHHFINFTKTYEPELINDAVNTMIVIDLTQFDTALQNHWIRLRIPEAYEISGIYYPTSPFYSSAADYQRSGVFVYIYNINLERTSITVYLPIVATKEDQP